MKIAQQFYFSEDNLWHFYHYIKLRYLQYFQGFWFNWEVGYSKKSFLNLWSIHFQNYIFIFIYLNHSNLRGGEMTNAILNISTFEKLYGNLHWICMFIPRQLRSQAKTTRNPVIYIWILVCKSTAWSQTKPYSNTSPYSKKSHFEHRRLTIESRFLFSSL